MANPYDVERSWPDHFLSGDDTAWSTLRSWLDLEVSGFHMHMR